MERERNASEFARVLSGEQLDADLLGGKGAALDRVIGYGIAVPPTAVVTTLAYRDVVAAPTTAAVIGRIRSGEIVSVEAIDTAFAEVTFADDAAAAVLDVASRVGDNALLAVRSSATVEDLAGASFAGQYRSLLEIDHRDSGAVLNAVKMVFASLWHPAPVAYRSALGIDDAEVAMAAVIMQMVSARRAGVAFTVEPGGAPEMARVEAVEGLGESLVSGQETPDAWVLPRATTEADGPSEIVEALSLAMSIERHEGRPQDVEWAFDGDTVWIVQSCPITVAATATQAGDGFDSPVGVAQLTTAGIGEMLPGVLPPLRWQLASHLVNEAFVRLVDELDAGSGPRGNFVHRVRGRAAMDFDALRELARRLPGGSVDELEAQYFGSRQPGRPATPLVRDSTRWSRIRHDVRSLALQRRGARDAEIAIRTVELLDELDPTALDSRALSAYQFRLIDLAVRATTAELAVAATASSSYRKVELLLAPHLGDAEAGRWAERVTSRRGMTVAPGPDASAAVFAGPTWTELDRQPPSATQIGQGAPLDPRAVEDELFTLLRETDSWGSSGLLTAIRSRALRQLIRETTTQLHRREATKAALLQLGGAVRRTILEQGRRLVDNGLLSDPSDIELLTMDEIAASLTGICVSPNTLGLRRRWQRRYEAEPPLPSVFVGNPERETAELPAGGRLDGWAASPGRYTGRATVVRDSGDHLDRGAVLVAAATDASWSPLFLRAGAIVVERGGPLSHAAILARELGVPAVLNVTGASQTLDGLSLTVDGDAGIVVVHERGEAGDATDVGVAL